MWVPIRASFQTSRTLHTTSDTDHQQQTFWMSALHGR